MADVKLDIWPSTITRGYGLGKDRGARVVRRGRVTGLTTVVDGETVPLNDKTAGDAAIDAVEVYLSANDGKAGTVRTGAPHLDFYYHHAATNLPLMQIRATRSLDAGATGALVDLIYQRPRLQVDLTREAKEQATYRAHRATLQWYQTSETGGGKSQIDMGGLDSVGLNAFVNPGWHLNRPNGDINFKPNPGTGGERVFDVPMSWSFIVPTVFITLPTILEKTPTIKVRHNSGGQGISSLLGSLNSNDVSWFSDGNTFGAKTLRLHAFEANPIEEGTFHVTYTAEYNPYTWQYQTVDFVDGEWVVHHVDMGPVKRWNEKSDFELHSKKP